MAGYYVEGFCTNGYFLWREWMGVSGVETPDALFGQCVACLRKAAFLLAPVEFFFSVECSMIPMSGPQ